MMRTPVMRSMGIQRRPQDAAARRRGQRGAALVVAILVLAILTVIGIALMLITSTEARIAANEWSINK
ncbi:MAG: pilus assembly PilX family protein, partial [Thermoanaerobaculia bacterium]